MKIDLHCCDDLRNAIEDKDIAITYTNKFREYGISILDGGSSRLRIRYCPWCGKKLPESLRNQWYEELERLGIDPDEDEIPVKFKDEEWYRNAGPEIIKKAMK